jgi:hypothetical protein
MSDSSMASGSRSLRVMTPTSWLLWFVTHRWRRPSVLNSRYVRWIEAVSLIE